jgi:hypothetical protein
MAVYKMGFDKTIALLKELMGVKQNFVQTLNDRGEGSSMQDSFATLVERSKNLMNDMPNTVLLVDENGAELVATRAGEEVIFTATANDIRAGKVAANDEGVVTGEKVIPSCHTTETTRYIPVGSAVTIPLPILDKYDYTKLQVVICEFNTSITDSVSVIKTSILDKVYNVNSVAEIANVVKDSVNKSINLGITNDTEKPFVVRCFTYKEIE